MHVTIQLISHSDAARGEHDRQLESFTVEFKRNGTARTKFLAELAADIKRLAKEHNARFDREHGAS